MERFSVKKPFTILVAVIMVLALGLVAVTRLTTDLLPSMSLPYLMVVTTYPGASPEKIENTVGQPMERALGTINGVKNVFTVSSDNYCMTQLEFEDGTDMDSAIVKVSSAVDEVSASLPEDAGTPSLMEISMDMLATMYVAVGREGYDIYELSDFVRDDVAPTLERQNGIASVTNVGIVDQSIQIELNQNKIDKINDRILEKTNKALAEARDALDEAQKKVDDGQTELEKQEKAFGNTVSSGLFSQMQGMVGPVSSSLQDQVNSLIDTTGEIEKILDQIPETAVPEQSAVPTLPAALQQAAQSPQAASGAQENPLQETMNALGALTPDPETGNITIDPTQYAAILQSLTSASDALQNASAEQAESYAQLMQQAAQIQEASDALRTALSSVDTEQISKDLSAQLKSARDGLSQLSSGIDQIPGILSQLESGYGDLTQAQLDAALGFAAASAQLTEGQAQLKEARRQYDASREAALANANLDALLTTETLSGLIYAQNFTMPAGYIDDANDNSWLLKVGDAFPDADSLNETLLVDLDEIGAVRVSDVAEVTVIDNAGDHYAKLNGENAICLCIYKASTAGTNEVSTQSKKTLEQIREDYPGTTVVPLMDQGIYIDLIVRSILSSMLLGAILAILVLALFLRDVRPTLVVGISIPLSVLFTIVLMYFSGLSLNMMTLSGLALGIGMLVDNSIVVMENIFRLRALDVPAPRAAVQGAKQVRGAITASTLTTVCVFLPMIFTTGTVRELLIPMALSIGYCLMASLVVALTVVPASASTLMRRVQPKPHKFFEKIQDIYGRALGWCLRRKIVVLALAILLLMVTVWQVIRTGIVLIPEMTSSDIQVMISTDDELEREASYAKTDEITEAILTVPGVEHVGILDESSTTALFSSASGNTSQYGGYICYVKADTENADEIRRIQKSIGEVTAPIEGCTVEVQSTSMSDMSSLMSSQSDLTINIYGADLNRLSEISGDVCEIVESVDGFKEATDGTEEGEQTLHLVIDKDKAMSRGLTVAQIYTDISKRLTTEVNAATITVDGVEMQISISDPTDPLTRENLMDMEFEPSAEAQAAAGMNAETEGFDLDALTEAAGDEESAGEDADAEDGDSAGENEDAEEADSAGENEDAEEADSAGDTDQADSDDKTVKLNEIASLEETTSLAAINRENMTRYMTVTANTREGKNTQLLVRELTGKINDYTKDLERGYRVEITGQSETINDMVTQMSKLLMLGLLFIYLVMVAQFQSLLSPFIVLFTVPLAFTGGMLGLMVAREPLSLLSLMGFLILVGTVVNNGIVFVDYTNQLRIGGMERRDALIVTGKTRMRPILMTALTTILAMAQLMFGRDMGAQLGRGMAIVIAGGLLYATLMTLFVIPIMYDIFFKRQPLSVDVGSDIDEAPDDAAQFLADLDS